MYSKRKEYRTTEESTQHDVRELIKHEFHELYEYLSSDFLENIQQIIDERIADMSINLDALKKVVEETAEKEQGAENLLDQLHGDVENLTKEVEGNPAAEAAVDAAVTTLTQLNTALGGKVEADTPPAPPSPPTPPAPPAPNPDEPPAPAPNPDEPPAPA